MRVYLDGKEVILADQILVNASRSFRREKQLLEVNQNADDGGAAINVWSATAAERGLFDFNRSKAATIGTYSVVASGDALGQITFRGADGAGFEDAAAISAAVDATPGADDMPGRLMFSTTADGAKTLSERMRIDNAGKVLVGHTADVGLTGSTGILQLNVSALAGGAVVNVWSATNVTDSADIVLQRSKSNTSGTHAIVASGDRTGRLISMASDGSAFTVVGAIHFEVDGTPGASDMPGRITFRTTADGASATSERMRINSSGQVLINGTASYGRTGTILEANVTTGGGIAITAWSATGGNAGNLDLQKSANDTVGTHTRPADGDTLGQLGYRASNGTAFVTTAFVRGEVDGAVGGATDLPARLTFGTTPDGSATVTERMRINASGQVLINQTSSIDPGGYGTLLEIAKSGYASAAFSSFSATAAEAPRISLQRSRHATIGQHTIVQDGDSLGGFVWWGSDGSAFRSAAAIGVSVDGTPGASDMPGRIGFSTTADGAATTTERMRISSAGKVLINASAGAVGPTGTMFEVNTVTNNAGAALTTWTSTAGNGAALDFQRSKSDTIGTHALVASGDRIGAINFRASDGVAFFAAAQIKAEMDAASGTNDVPGRLVFSTTPDGSTTLGERMRIDSSGRVLINGTASYGRLGELLEVNSSGASGGAAFCTWSAASATHEPILDFDRSYSSTIGTYAAVRSGDSLGLLCFRGADGTKFVPAASIESAVDATPGADDMPGRLMFYTTADGASSSTERMRINCSGQVLVNGTASYGATGTILEANVASALAGVAVNGWTATAGEGPSLALQRSKSATIGTHAIVASGDMIGQLAFRSSTGAAFVTSASIRAEVDGAVSGATDIPARLAFYVTPDGTVSQAEKMRLDNTGRLLIGGTAAYGAVTQMLEVNSSAVAGGEALNTWSATAAEASYLSFQRSKSAAVGTQAIVASGDALGFLSWRGSDGVALIPAAQIKVEVDAAPGVNDMPGRLVFSTTADGAATVTERMRITSAGVVVVNGTAAYGRFAQMLEVNAAANMAGVALNTWSASSVEASALDLNRSKDNTKGTYTAVADNDLLGYIQFRGADGAAFVSGAGISAAVDGTPGSNDMPARLLLSTTADGASAPTERLRIDSKGHVGIGTAATPDQMVELAQTDTVAGAVADGYAAALRLDPAYTAASAQTVDRHNYIDYQNPNLAGTGPAALTDACVGRFDAAAGTHKAVDSGSTKTTPGTVDAWLKYNVNGAIYYSPLYTSKTT